MKIKFAIIIFTFFGMYSCQNADTVIEKEKVKVQSEVTNHQIKYAKGFTISQQKDYKILTLKNP